MSTPTIKLFWFYKGDIVERKRVGNKNNNFLVATLDAFQNKKSHDLVTQLIVDL